MNCILEEEEDLTSHRMGGKARRQRGKYKTKNMLRQWGWERKESPVQ